MNLLKQWIVKFFSYLCLLRAIVSFLLFVWVSLLQRELLLALFHFLRLFNL